MMGAAPGWFRVWLREMAGRALERALGCGGPGSGFKGLQPVSGLGTRVHTPVLQSHGAHRGDLGFPERGFFNFSFCKALSQEWQGLEELLDVAGASEAGRPWCPLSLAPNPL